MREKCHKFLMLERYTITACFAGAHILSADPAPLTRVRCSSMMHAG